jgi:hypothetical protein
MIPPGNAWRAEVVGRAKGPAYAPGVKRLAMPTEDHPIDYLDFEGVIPQGQYGGGTVMVWDIGTYEVIEGNYYKGFLRFYLAGRKLKGEWTLARSREQTSGRVSWYLEKSEPAMRAISANATISPHYRPHDAAGRASRRSHLPHSISCSIRIACPRNIIDFLA